MKHEGPWSAEFRLAVECCRRSFGKAGRETAVGEPQGNWRDFLHLVRFHRIEGLAWNILSSDERVPSEARLALSSAAAEIAGQNLLASAASRDLLERFTEAGVPLLFLKGLTVGALAYGSASLKSCIDIDLLIDPSDLQKAAHFLRAAGYELIAPRRSSSDHDLDAWHRRWKESVWGSVNIQIDLHTRTADNPRLIRKIDVHSPRQTVAIGNGQELPTLADDELFAYLAVHGASSAWFRLKWISDFAGFLRGKSSDELRHLYRRSQELGAGRAAGQALLLAHQLFDTLAAAPTLGDELRGDRAIVSLYQTAFKLLTGLPNEPTEQRFGTFPIHRSQFQLQPGLGYKLSELSSQAMRRITRVR